MILANDGRREKWQNHVKTTMASEFERVAGVYLNLKNQGNNKPSLNDPRLLVHGYKVWFIDASLFLHFIAILM